MNYPDDARAEELHNLRLALATFALQIDAFELQTRELQTRERPIRAGIKTGALGPLPRTGSSLQKEDKDWLSIKSHGNKRAG
jgi:hypothetical protein